jgi:single-stranded-DNA-specific exonuclease
MLYSKLKWKLSEEVTVHDELDRSFSNSIIKKLLLQRGIFDQETAAQFLYPDLNHLISPSKLSMIDEAAGRIHRAIENKEKILVFGDYDADGISSTTLLLKALQELGADCDFYIPNRYTEGYGPNEAAFQVAYEQGFTLIITVDCGISSVQEAAFAKNLGIDLIITDHHEPQEVLPDAYAIIHPKCSPDYSFKELAGVGVAFKLAEYLLGYLPKHLLEYTALGTIADLVPLIDENRILSFYGLHALTNTNNEGLKALMKVAGIEGDVTEEDVGFSIGPRLNSVGRLQDARLAVQLLLTEDRERAMEIASEIDLLNQHRKQIVKEIAAEADLHIDSEEKEGVIVVANENWNEGVLGIVASRLVQKYERPAIVLAIKPEEGIAKGSARSIPSFDLFKNCMMIKDCFTHFGGHAQAAGMTLPIENIDHLQTQLSSLIREQLSEEDYKQEIEIAGELSVFDVTEELIESVNKLAPFGMGNPKPVFMLKEVPQSARQIGSERNHLKLQFQQDQQKMDGIGFGYGYLHHFITKDTPLTVVGELSINEWNGIKKPQIVIQDASIDEWQLFDRRGKKQQDFSPYMEMYDDHVIVGKKKISTHPKVKYISYHDIPEQLGDMDALYINELPDDLDQLKQMIQLAQPKNIHVCYSVDHSLYMRAFPKREEFVWLYSLVRKQQMIDLNKHLEAIQKMKDWSKDHILFMSEVFSELGFVKIDNGVMTANPNPEKRNLQESSTYQERLKKIEIEKTLYFSNYEQLKDWFQQFMDYLKTPEEAAAYGL